MVRLDRLNQLGGSGEYALGELLIVTHLRLLQYDWECGDSLKGGSHSVNPCADQLKGHKVQGGSGVVYAISYQIPANRPVSGALGRPCIHDAGHHR